MENKNNNFRFDSVGLPTAALLGKGVRSKEGDKKPKVDMIELSNIVSKSLAKQDVNNDIVDLFPDVEFCASTYTNNILSPTDNLSKDIGLDFKTANVPLELKSSLINYTCDTLISTYGFNSSKLEDIVKKSMFYDGAYVEIFIPEAAVDEIINKDVGEIKLEDHHSRFKYAKRKNILDSGTEYGSDFYLKTESGEPYIHSNAKEVSYLQLEASLGVTFGDDLGVINDKSKEAMLVSDVMDNAYYGNLKTESGVSNEDDTEYNQIMNFLRTNKSFEEEQSVTLSSFDSTRRPSVGRSLMLNVNPAVVKPIWSGDPSNHIGYVLALDGKGNPVTGKVEPAKEKEMNTFFKVNKTQKKHKYAAFVEKAKKSFYGMVGKEPDLTNMEDIYNSLLNNLITTKIKNGIFGDSVNWTEDNDFNKIMFSRALESKKTRMVFLPASMVTYYAYDYKNNGMGRGKLERISVLYSMRAILLFTRLMATVKNSIPRTEISAEIPEEVTDVNSAVSDIIAFSELSGEGEIPLGAPSTGILTEWMNKVGKTYKITHPTYPALDIKVEDKQRNIPVPDDTLEELLAEAGYKQFGLSKEQVDEGFKGQTATSIVTNNRFFANRVTNSQNKTMPMFSDNIRKIIKNDSVFYDGFRELVEGSKSKLISKNKALFEDIKDKEVVVKALTDWLIGDLTMVLPPVIVEDGSTSDESVKNYSDNVESYLDVLFDDDAWDPDTAGELGENISAIKAKLKAVLVHDFIVENNVMKPLTGIFAVDKDGNAVNDSFKDFDFLHARLSEIYLKHIKVSKKTADNFDEKKEKIDDGVDDEPSNPESVNTENIDNTDGGDVPTEPEEPTGDSIDEN